MRVSGLPRCSRSISGLGMLSGTLRKPSMSSEKAKSRVGRSDMPPEGLAHHGGAHHLAEGADMRQARGAIAGLEQHIALGRRRSLKRATSLRASSKGQARAARAQCSLVAHRLMFRNTTGGTYGARRGASTGAAPHPRRRFASGPSLCPFHGRGKSKTPRFFSLSRKAGEGRGEGVVYSHHLSVFPSRAHLKSRLHVSPRPLARDSRRARSRRRIRRGRLARYRRRGPADHAAGCRQPPGERATHPLPWPGDGAAPGHRALPLPSICWSCSPSCGRHASACPRRAAWPRRWASHNRAGWRMKRSRFTTSRAPCWRSLAPPRPIPASRAWPGPWPRAGWAWGPAVLGTLGLARKPATSGSGLDVWAKLPEWQDYAPPPPPGSEPVEPAEARKRLAELLGEGAEARPQQADYASAVAAAFAPAPGGGRAAIRAGRGGHRRGQDAGLYRARQPLGRAQRRHGLDLAPSPATCSTRSTASSTGSIPTRSAQDREDGHPQGPGELSLPAELRGGSARPAGARPADAVALGLVARWALAPRRDGDIAGGDFPGWLADLIGRSRSLASPTGAANASIPPATITATASSSAACAAPGAPASSSPITR